MKNKKDFDHAFHIGTITLIMSGVLISDLKVDNYINIFLKKWLFFFNVAWIQTDVLGFINRIIDGFKKGTSMGLSLLLPNVTLCNLNILKIAPLYFNTDDLKALYDKFKELHPMKDPNDEKAAKMVNESVRLIRVIGITLIITFMSCGGSFCVLPMLQMLYNYLTTGRTDMFLPFDSKYFFEVDTVFIYVLVYIHHVYSTIIAGVNMIGFEATFCAYCTLIQMHFRLLSQSFENEIRFKPRMSTDKLVKMVLKHRRLISLGEQMDAMFSKSTLFHMVLGSLLTAFCLFNLALTPNIRHAIEYFTFLIMSIVQIFVMSFFGDMLITSSTQFSQAIYNTNWYETDAEGKKFVLFILMRAQKPCKITAAGFADLRMTTLTSVLTSAWSYFALLKSMISK